MSILLTTNVIKSESGFPIGPIAIVPHVEIASVFKFCKIPFDFIDNQTKQRSEWLNELQKRDPKVLVIYCDEAYIQELKTIKEQFSTTTIIAVFDKQECINNLVFDYGIDYVFWGTNYAYLAQLVQAIISPFTVFYDHIPAIAYKNGLGELTKTQYEEIKPELVKVYSVFCLEHKKVLLPFGYQIDADHSVDILNGAGANVLTDLDAFDPNINYTSYVLRVAANKKVKLKLIDLIQNKNFVGNLTIYPSCDIFEDTIMYQKIAKAVSLASEINKSGFFMRLLLKIRLNKFK